MHSILVLTVIHLTENILCGKRNALLAQYILTCPRQLPFQHLTLKNKFINFKNYKNYKKQKKI